MKVIKTKLEDCLIIQPNIYKDDRGYFLETFNSSKYMSIAGIKYRFVQDNHSFSKKNVLRGLHFQKENPQGKLVSVISGEVFDVAVDIRKDSKTFGQWKSVILSSENKTQFWIPPGFAHGFVVLSDFANFVYKCTDYYDPKDEETIVWNDPSININWPVENPVLSEKDTIAKKLLDLDL